MSGSPKAIVHLIRDATLSHDLQFLVQEKLRETGTESANDHPVPAVDLTAREREVLSLIKQGANTVMIAEKLCISRATVRNHIQNVFSKLGVHTRLEAVAHINGYRL
ncbi:MAG: HTH domain-containing protein [Acidobacteria bacterium]|nr:HTH domain-containing protein [Acidobacteriota bacterium]